MTQARAMQMQIGSGHLCPASIIALSHLLGTAAPAGSPVGVCLRRSGGLMIPLDFFLRKHPIRFQVSDFRDERVAAGPLPVLAGRSRCGAGPAALAHGCLCLYSLLLVACPCLAGGSGRA